MPTAAEMLPPPGGGADPQAPPGGGFPSPAPPQQDQGAMQILDMVRNIVSSARMIGMKVPAAVPIVRQINDLAAQLQAKIIQSQPQPEAQAPPV